MTIYVLLALLLVLAGVFAWATPRWRAMAVKNHAFIARYVARLEEIMALPMEEARHQAELLLADPHTFQCVPMQSPSDDAIASLSPGLQDLFSRFERVQAVGTESILDRDLIAPFGWDWKERPWRRHQVWQIGSSHEHGLILVKPHQEGIYDTDGMEPDNDLNEPDFQSVYHWLLMAATDFSSPKT